MHSPRHHVVVLHLRNARPSNPRYQAELDMLNSATLQVIQSLGWTSELVATAEQSTTETLVATREADMIVLMGGEDVAPALYTDNERYPGSGQHESRADRAQIAVVLEALQQRTPLLGICRGIQLINVALGGTLIQHLAAENHRSRNPSADAFVPTRLSLDPDADLSLDVDPSQAVLCTHHQSVDQLGKGLRVAARASDGGIEAVIHDSAPVTAVQWHPEHPRTASTQLFALLRRLERQLSTTPAPA